MRSRRYWLMAGGLALLGFLMLKRRWLAVNDITTGKTPEYPDLPPHIYAADAQTVRNAAYAACLSLPRWRIAPAQNGDTSLHVEVRTLLFGFVDDVTVWFEPINAPPGSGPNTQVVIRSHSRVGKGDLGENARHIAALQEAMDARLRQAQILK